MKYVLGINSVYHESSAAILKDGVLIAAVEEERFVRKKHAKAARVDNPDEMPYNSINFCLQEAGISMAQVDYIAYAFDPESRNNYWKDEYFEPGSWGTPEGEKIFYEKLSNIPNKLSEHYGCDIKNKFIWVNHHLSHAAGSFFVSPFKKAVTIVVDGIGENSTGWIGYGEDNKLNLIKDIPLPNSLGFLWEKFSEYLGFTEYDAGKVMGLSSYGDWKVYWKQFEKIVSFNEKDIFTVNKDILRFRVKDFTKLEELFDVKKREMSEELKPEQEHIAASLQKMTEKIMLRLVKHALKSYPCDNVCLSGGVILNCVANEELFRKLPVKDIFIPPAVHDGGNSIGAAYYVWNQVLGHPRKFVLTNPYTGPKYEEEDIKEAIKKYDVAFEKIDQIETHTAKLLSDGNIIAWFQDRIELGPRALGNRSILADPRLPNMQEIINVKVKKRERFRPFAPSVLEEKAMDWFYYKTPRLSDRFMLFAVDPVFPEKIPAVTHVDETCRTQVVSKEMNPKFHKLIEEFDKITGIPILLNTSFNIQEPIVCSPDDAVRTFLKSKMDYLIMHNYVVKNKNI